MRDEPEGTVLDLFADVAINHGTAEFAEFTRKNNNWPDFFFFKNGA
jgi:hypothetical protein